MSLLTRLALRWRLATILITLLIVAAGTWTLTRMQIALFPNIDFPLVTVVTAYPQTDSETVLQEIIPIGRDYAVNCGRALRQVQGERDQNRSW